MWLLPVGDDCESTYLTKLGKFKPTLLLQQPLICFSPFSYWLFVLVCLVAQIGLKCFHYEDLS
jgi:hypothetical protein